MNDKKGWGSTVLGWFVVKEEGDETSSSEGVPDVSLPAAAGAAAPAPAPVVPVGEIPAAPGGNVDFAGVFKAFGVDDEERDRFQKASDLLGNLPEGTDPVVKKQIVEASLKAFGISIDKIIEAGVEQIQALDAYQKSGGADTQKVSEEAEKRVQEFEEEIRRLRQVVAERVSEQMAVVKACNDRKLAVQKVLEFFGQEAVARVVRDSPKLVDPSAPSAPRP